MLKRQQTNFSLFEISSLCLKVFVLSPSFSFLSQRKKEISKNIKARLKWKDSLLKRKMLLLLPLNIVKDSWNLVLLLNIKREKKPFMTIHVSLSNILIFPSMEIYYRLFKWHLIFLGGMFPYIKVSFFGGISIKTLL